MPNRSTLEEFERENSTRPPYILTKTELKLLGIAGVGFFLDAYDLFIINVGISRTRTPQNLTCMI